MSEFRESTVISNSGWTFSIGTLLEDYGWYILILVTVLLYIYKQFQPSIDKYFKNKADQEYRAKYHKNPDLATARIAAQQTAAQRLQEKYNKDAEKFKLKMEEKEAKKLEERLNRQNPEIGQKLGSGSSSLRSEYNPLMGDNSRSYRPQRKSPCAGGGCGKK